MMINHIQRDPVPVQFTGLPSLHTMFSLFTNTNREEEINKAHEQQER